jgi:uncharacterized protein (DUF2267 family)
MSEDTSVRQINQATQQAHDWLRDLAGREPFQNHDQAYSLLRAVLHTVRDRLTAEEVAHLGSQLPMIVRGFYFEGWRPALAPNDFSTIEAFLERVRSCLGTGTAMDVNLREATLETLRFLADHVDSGEMRHVVNQMPAEIKTLFPEAVRP